MWPAEKCGKRCSKQWSAEYFESAENLRIFRGRYIVRTLTKWQHYYIVLLSALSPFHRLQNTWLWMTLNRHFALNSVLRWYVWSSEAWLSIMLLSLLSPSLQVAWPKESAQIASRRSWFVSQGWRLRLVYCTVSNRTTRLVTTVQHTMIHRRRATLQQQTISGQIPLFQQRPSADLPNHFTTPFPTLEWILPSSAYFPLGHT